MSDEGKGFASTLVASGRGTNQEAGQQQYYTAGDSEHRLWERSFIGVVTAEPEAEEQKLATTETILR